MLLKILGFLCGVRALAAEDNATRQSPPPLLVVSFDGFRADYLQKYPMSNLKLLYSQGVLVEELKNVFITKTFPNHYSLMTGLYAESHGMVSSNMYDSATHMDFHVRLNDSNPMWWNEARPLWITALDSGYKTAAAMWPGSDVVIGNRMPSHFLSYDSHVSFQQRLGNITNWMLGDKKEPGVMFAVLYWEEPDTTGHLVGPENVTFMSKALKEVDDNIGLLVSELKRTGLWGHINLVITSDHGMVQCSTERLIRLDDCIHPDTYQLVDYSPVAALLPLKDAEDIFARLSKCHAHMTAYLKSDIPDRLHYRNNKRIQPILLIADEGWTIVQRGDRLPHLGDHGYDNSLPSMHTFMAASGPSFRQGYRMRSMHTVDVYPLLCHLLSVPPQPNNGSLTQARCLLAAEFCSDVHLIIAMVVGVLLTLTTVTVLFWCVRSRRPSNSRSFQRLQIDDDDEILVD